MQQLLFLRFFLFLSVTLFTTQIRAQNLEKNPIKDTLSVGIAGDAPFVSIDKTTKAPEGITIEIWEDLASNKKWNYKYIPYNTTNDALHALNRGNLDLLVGPISITSQRVAQMNFSQPYYQSSLAIASRLDEVTLWNRIKPFFSLKLLTAISIFLFILAIVGTLLWLAERNASPDQFPKDPIKGIANGMWLAIVTMSTTGYGDMAPITPRGRVIAGIWMIVSIISATSMVAGIASTLTLSGLGTTTITNIEQLSNKKVATLTDAPAITFLEEYNANITTVKTINDAMNKLKNKEVSAVVYDRPQLLYYLKNNENDNLQIAKAEYYKQGYGLAFPLNSSLVYDVNRSLLELAENHTTQRIIDYYLGKDK